jgi:glycine/D-amino acid oxidase-like deaminating enzyme
MALERAIACTVDEIAAVIAREGIECDFVHGGTLAVAQTPLELDHIRAQVETERAWGMGPDDVRLLSAEEVRARIAVDGALGARYFAHCARVQPAALARGLADAAERAGAVIYEHTRVEEIRPGIAVTASGTVRARHIVRATEGYTATLPGMRRVLVPLGSSMIVTEPLDQATWRRIGWEGGETLHAGQHRYVYLQRTADGRIAIGGRGVPYRFASRTEQPSSPPQRTIDALRARLTQLFGGLEGIGIDQAWHGVLGVSRAWLPAVGLDPGTGIAWAGGYVGQGVAAANLAGRTLRDLLLGRETELTRLPWVGPIGRPWEPEPLRYIGIHAVHSLLASADRRESRTNRPAPETKLARLISGQDL